MSFMWSSKKKETGTQRSHYKDNSEQGTKFMDWVDRLGLEKTLLGRLLIQLEERFKIKRLALLFIYSLALAWFMSFQFEIPLNLKVGDTASADIYSPISFEMTDDVATEEKRYRAEKTVPPVFDYDIGVFERITGNIYKGFRSMRQEAKNTRWPKDPIKLEEAYKEFFQHKLKFENALNAQIPDAQFEWLVKNRFSARIENFILISLDDWLHKKLADSLERILAPSENKVFVRIIQQSTRGREYVVDRSEIIEIAQPDSLTLEDVRGLQKASQQEKEYIQRISRVLVQPNLTFNRVETNSRRQSARATIMPINLSIKKGQAIIKDGTVLQPYHMAILRNLQENTTDRKKDFNSFLMALLFVTMVLVFFSYVRRFSLNKVRVTASDIQLMAFVTLFTVLLVKLFLFFTDASLTAKFGKLIPSDIFLYALPVATAPMLIGLLITSGEVVWLFTVFIMSVLGIMVEMNFQFVLVSLVGGIAAARGVYGCKTRNHIYVAGLRTGLINLAMIGLIKCFNRGDNENFALHLVLTMGAGFASGVLSSLIAMMIIPLLESIFNYTTDVKLLELSNLNHPLLKEMIVRAPGTYHHSMLIGTMVEAAAEEISANPLLAKVMSYYHDIGKIEHAHYFIENQKIGHNPHDNISPYMSKTILIAHVKDGIDLGIKYKLGKPILDGIVQHHGTTLISYFYNKALDAQDDRTSEVAEADFRYPGPKPQFREAALVMLADSIEAAARSLDEPTPVRLQNIVKNIIQRKFMDGQLDECNLTLKDLGKVEESFLRTLLGIYHQRIDYPRNAGGGASETPVNLFKASSHV